MTNVSTSSTVRDNTVKQTNWWQTAATMLTGETQVTAMNGKAFVFIVINLNQPHHYTTLFQSI